MNAIGRLPRICAMGLGASVILSGCHQVRRTAAKAGSETPIQRRAVIEETASRAFSDQTRVLEADPRGCTWVESTASVAAGEDETPHQLRAAATEAARRAAMASFLGVAVKSRLLDFQQEGLREQKQIIESMLLTTRQGRILDEKLNRDGYEDIAGCPHCRYGVSLKTCLVPNPDYADKDFTVEMGLSRNALVHGDEVTLKVTATKDCYLYVYDLWRDWEKTALLVPNAQVPAVFLKAGETWEYPDDKARKAGVSKLVAELPEGYTVSAETLRVIASKTPLDAKTIDPSEGFLAVLQRMNRKRADWAEDAQVFTIRNK